MEGHEPMSWKDWTWSSTGCLLPWDGTIVPVTSMEHPVVRLSRSVCHIVRVSI